MLEGKNKAFKKNTHFLIVLLSAYMTLSALPVIYLLSRYYFVNIKTIEPEYYVPDRDGFYVKGPGAGDTTDSNIPTGDKNQFHINNLGSRNLFEVTEEDAKLVVLLGDSHFFGVGLNDNETLSFFLNQIDKERRYINFALPGVNVCDSVERYFLKGIMIKPPNAIILQILLRNDICASSYIEKKIIKKVERDYGFILQPYRMILSKNRLYRFYLDNIYRKIYGDLSDERFAEYIQDPLSRLIWEASKSGTKVIIISYDTPDVLRNYDEKLENFCAQNNVYFFLSRDLIKEEDIKNSRLKDGHPSRDFNRAIADSIKNKVDDIDSI